RHQPITHIGSTPTNQNRTPGSTPGRPRRHRPRTTRPPPTRSPGRTSPNPRPPAHAHQGRAPPVTEQILPMEVTRVPTQHITPHPDNARQGNTDLIAQSLEHNGQYRPLVVQTSTGHVLAGNHTLAAAKALGWDQVAVQYLDVDDTAAKKILLADNKTSDEATYDDQLLARLLSDL